MTSYPRKSKLFQAWAKAMVEGATVDKPSYPGTKLRTRGIKRRKPRKRKNRRKTRAKKES